MASSNCWDENREKVCRACDSPFYKKVNSCCETSFYRIGVLTAIYAPAILVFCLVFFGGLGLGIFQSRDMNDIYSLWIEKGSRLLGERAFTAAHHSGGATRAAFQVFTSKDYSSNGLAKENLPFVFDTVTGGLSITGFDEDLGTVGFHDLCDRVPTPTKLLALMRMTGAAGFPCTKFAPTDCFSEGELGTLGFDLPDAFLDRVSAMAPVLPYGPGCCSGNLQLLKAIPVINPTQNVSETDIVACKAACTANKRCIALEYFPFGSGNAHSCNLYTSTGNIVFSVASIRANNTGTCNAVVNQTQCFNRQAPFSDKYLFQKSYKNLSNEQILEIVNTPRVGCTNWIPAQPPENVMFGGVQRNAAGQILKVPSSELLFQLKSPTNFAKTKCTNQCWNKNCSGLFSTALKDFGSKSKLGDPGSCQLAISTAAAACGLKCTGNSSYANATIAGANSTLLTIQNQSLFDSCCVNNTCPPALATLGIGGTCNPLAPAQAQAACPFCVKAIAQAIPVLAACIQVCATPAGGGCVGNLLAAGTGCELGCQASCKSPDQDSINVATQTLMGWETNFINYMTNVTQNKSSPFTVDYFTDRSVSDLVGAAGAADAILIVVGYIVMVAFGCITLFQFDTIQSRLMLGFVGMLLVIISIVGSMGMIAIVGIAYVPTIVQVLPFLALGLGTYDMFVMAFNFSYIPEKTVPAMLGELMKECGPRLLLTATTNIIVFGIGANIPLAAVNYFSGAMCIVIFFNFLILVFGFGAVIALNAERMRKNKVDCLCCLNAKYKSNSISTDKAHQIGRCPTEFARLMFTKPMQAFILVASIIIFAVGMWGITKIQIGLPLQDIVPKDGYTYGFLKVRDTFYKSGASFIISGYKLGQTVTVDHSDPKFMADVMTLETELQVLKGVDASFPIWSTSWIDGFLVYCSNINNGIVPPTPPCARNGTSDDPVKRIFFVNNSASPPAPAFFLSNSRPTWPNKTLFAMHLNLYLTSSGLNNIGNMELDADGNIISAKIQYFTKDLFTDQDAVNYIVASRALVDATPQPVYLQGQTYDLYEQYVHVRDYLGTNLGYTCIGVLLITSVFLFHPGATLIMFAMIVLTMAEIYGFLAFFGLKVNGVSVVNMVTAIGVIVAPVAHITRVFMVSQGTNAARAEHALALMTFPMLFSTVSTFVGEFPLEFARFPYFRLYFFYQYVIIGVITLINAFLPLPLMLSFLGPPPLTEDGPSADKPAAYEKGGLVEIPGLEESGTGGRD